MKRGPALGAGAHFPLDPRLGDVEKHGAVQTHRSLLHSRFFVSLAALLFVASHAFSTDATFGRHQYIEYLPGDLPLVFSAPHGGREKPDEIPDRTEGVLDIDTNTQELIRAVGDEIHARTGHRAHLIICRLARRKLDGNREIVEAAAGNPNAEQAWKEYHGFIEQACATAIARFGKTFLIDLHGQSHKDQRIELGYLHSAETLALSDAELNAPALVATSSIRLVAARTKRPYVELLRGPRSLGALLEAQGYAATPSPARPPRFTTGAEKWNRRRIISIDKPAVTELLTVGSGACNGNAPTGPVAFSGCTAAVSSAS